MDPSGDIGSCHKLTLQVVGDSYVLDYLGSCLWTVGKRRASNGVGHDSVEDSLMGFDLISLFSFQSQKRNYKVSAIECLFEHTLVLSTESLEPTR